MREQKFSKGSKISFPYRYINKQFWNCPLCGGIPEWKMRTIGILGPRIQFQCEKCECVLSTPIQEFTSPLSNKSYTWYGALKESQGKSLETYLRIEDGGIYEKNWEYVGREYTASQLRELNNRR